MLGTKDPGNPLRMKKFFIIAAALLLVCACAKDGPEQFRGDYSFKTGGSIDIAGTAYSLWGLIKKDTVLTRSLIPEAGQMHIVNEAEKGKMKVTMNVMGGDPVVFSAEVDGNTLLLLPVRRIVPVAQVHDGLNVGYDLTVCGSGVCHENTVVFQLDFTGDFSFEGFDGKVIRSRANCIATRNE